ncbi:hypothetical protein [Phormidium sp. CCY1219]|uniref:hypothetical protein n=1 Tax=Phormidium sp. CCY1219 TaxID=2886104 RepID=UPI002D1EC85B|nr:hypothetical protein [Phormidium sp. CCY1219]MEB3825872.1 hypothetical protein [Phormidium sp. CCY1219]
MPLLRPGRQIPEMPIFSFTRSMSLPERVSAFLAAARSGGCSYIFRPRRKPGLETLPAMVYNLRGRVRFVPAKAEGKTPEA